MSSLNIAKELPAVPSDVLFDINGFPVSNAMLSGLLVSISVIIFSLFIVLFTKQRGVPSSFQIIVEQIYEIFSGYVSGFSKNINLRKTVLPIVGTIFLYIGLSNIFLVIPGLEALTFNVNGEEVSLFRTHTSDFNTTFGIAIAIVLWTQLYSISQVGVFRHFGQYVRIAHVVRSFSKGIGAGMTSIVDFFIGLIGIVSELAKALSLSFRLFGNMFAGLLLGGIVLSALAIIAPVPIILYSLFSGLLQALVFGALTASYFSTIMPEPGE